MLKQHCDICDCIIPREESFRTMHFGRGNNLRINIGIDPMVICKKCWLKMIESVKPDAVNNEEALLDKASGNADMKQHIQRVDNLVNDIADFIIKGSDKSCENCAYNDSSLTEEPCCKCTGKDKWVNKDG